MSQCARILRALESGPVSPIDFAAPNVMDGGKPIMRVAARVQDLRGRGHDISTRTASNGTAVYTLMQGAQQDTATEESREGFVHPDAGVLLSAPTPEPAGLPQPAGSALFNADEFAPRDAYRDQEAA